MSRNPKISKEIMNIINETAERAVKTERLRSAAEDPYKITEKRLYAYPDLKKKLVGDKNYLIRLETGDTDERSKSIVRFSRSGYRFSPEDMLETMIRDLKSTIANDEHEVAAIDRALKHIKKDSYYQIVPQVYFESKDRDDIAREIPCDVTTVWRNRKRLVNRLAVILYGTLAI